MSHRATRPRSWHWRTLGFSLLLVASFIRPVFGDKVAEPLRPPRIAESPRIDGRLDEALWQDALLIVDFVQRQPREGLPASERTEVRIAYTPTDLYVGFRAYDSRAAAIVATARKRDDFAIVENDQFAMAIDSYNDGRSGFWFSTNPLGVRVDAQFFEEGERWLGEWNGIWDCASHLDDQGWTSELRIPFSTLRFRTARENLMGLNLYRRIIRTSEGLFSPPIPLSYAQGTPSVSIARKVAFQGLTRGRQVWLRPYALGGLARESTPSAERRTTRSDVGGDVTWAVTPSLTGTLTVNTDFALTELDDRQINLTRYDLFFPEKRDFFLETGGLFALGLPEELEVFFSRRIGLESDAEGRTRAVPVRGGGKLTGRAGAFELGVLDVATEATSSRAPENFLVLRTKRGLGDRSYLGLIGTHKLTDGRLANAVVGADATVYLMGQVGASGFLALSRGREDAPEGSAHGAMLFKAGERDSFKLGYLQVGRGFNPEMGFVRRPGVRRFSADVRLPWYAQAGRLRRLIPRYAGEHVTAADGFVESWSHELALDAESPAEDLVSLGGGVRFESVPQPFRIFRSVVVPEGPYRTGWVKGMVRTKPGRTLSGEMTLSAGGLYDGEERGASARLALKASRSLTGWASWATSWIRRERGSFRTEIAQARLDYARDTHLSASALAQYDNASRDLGFDLRLRYELKEGTALALVYSEIADRDADARPERLFGRHADRSLIVKITYLLGL
jgi:hypothetical protein